MLLADVLEHLVDPWRFLKSLRAVLAPGCDRHRIDPEHREPLGARRVGRRSLRLRVQRLLDKTHLRFFTRQSIAALFDGAGYEIVRWERVGDGRVDDATRRRMLGVMLPVRVAGRLAGRRVTVRGVGDDAYEDLRTYVFFVVARPRTGKTAGIAGDGSHE